VPARPLRLGCRRAAVPALSGARACRVTGPRSRRSAAAAVTQPPRPRALPPPPSTAWPACPWPAAVAGAPGRPRTSRSLSSSGPSVHPAGRVPPAPGGAAFAG